jgi:hypothetical protein
MKTIFDPSFRYTPSFNTDIRKTFARLRNEQRRARRDVAPPTDAATNAEVIALNERKRLGR